MTSGSSALMRVALGVAAVMATSAAWPEDTLPTETCDSQTSCLQRLRVLAAELPPPPRPSSPELDALARRLVDFAPAMVPTLAALLASEDENVAFVAAYAISHQPRIDPDLLPAIRVGLDRKLSWLAGALGQIDSDEAAVEALLRYLAASSSPQNQEIGAVLAHSRRAIPLIVEAARCETGCGERQHYLLGYVLGEMGDERLQVVPGLLAIATDASQPESVAAGAVSMLGKLGPEAGFLETDLLALRAQRVALQAAIDEALVGIGSDVAGLVFAERLRDEPTPWMLRDLAATRRAGHLAGPEVVALLEHEDWDIRLAAARTLGFIGYQPAVAALLSALAQERDVALNWASATSLVWIGDPAAKEGLRQAATGHWHPAVRLAAGEPMGEAVLDKQATAYAHPAGFAGEFLQDGNLQGEPCRRYAVQPRQQPPDALRHDAPGGEIVRTLSYTVTQRGYRPVSPGDADQNGDAGPGMTRVEREVEHTPELALRLPDGWLAGRHGGEWGGELMFLDDSGKHQLILKEKLLDLVYLGGQLVAVTSTAAHGMGDGWLHRLQRRDGVWSASRWRRLSGDPHAIWLSADGELLVEAYGGGAVLVAGTGAMRVAPCLEPGESEPPY